jgi:hypothetical protein
MPAYQQQYYRDHREELLARANQYYHENKDAVRWQKLEKAYGITKFEYERLYAEQGGCCAICGNPVEAGGKNSSSQLNVDHDHQTRVVRGLLCAGCNKLLGCAQDSIEILSKAIEYLRKSHGG